MKKKERRASAVASAMADRQRAEGKGRRAEGRGQRAEGKGRRAEGRGQRAI